MNEQIPPRKRGIVINFPRLTERQLGNMIADLGLSLTVSDLVLLQTHYRSVEKRDPTLDELNFLDEYYASRDSRNIPVAELTTNSKVIAETYADMMQKREEVNKSITPPTIEELLALSTEYLNSRGRTDDLTPKKKKKKSYIASALAGKDAPVRLAAKEHKTAVQTPVGALGTKKITKKDKIKKLSKSDFVLLITPSEEMSENDFADAVLNLITENDIVKIKYASACSQRMLIDVIAEINHGIYVDVDSIFDDNTTNELNALCRRTDGVIVIVRAKDIIETIKRLSDLNLRSAVVGSLIKKNHIAVRHGNYPLVTWNDKLLSLPIAIPKLLSLRTSKDAKAGKLTADFRAYSPKHHIALASTEAKIGDENISPYLTALYTTLTAAAQCVASGANYTDITLSADIPQSLSPADTLSTILGLYRVEEELCALNKESRIAAPTKRLAVAAAAKVLEDPIPAGLCKPDNMVYLLLPRYSSDGLPDFEDMRRMWRYVRILSKEGTLSSIFAPGQDGAAPALGAISSRCKFEPLPDLDPEILTKCAAGGFIVETSSAIEGLLIGHSREKSEISQ